MWKVFRENSQARKPGLFFLLKVLLVAAGFISLILFIVLIGTFAGN
jgi:hypothetical protein